MPMSPYELVCMHEILITHVLALYKWAMKASFKDISDMCYNA